MYPNYQQPFNNVAKVAGVDAVRNFQMGPNSMGIFVCENEDVAFIKTTDSTGFPTIRGFDLTEFSIEQRYSKRRDEVPKDYVTHEELATLSGKIDRLMEALNG